MPIYMDLHIVPGVNAKEVATAHSQDVYLEKDHSCKCLTYWVDEQKGHVFCLIDAPSKEVVIELHSKSHGLVPHKIIEVEPNIVSSFLGRITDPDIGERTEDGLLLINESSYRVMMLVRLPDPFIYKYQGKENESEWQQKIIYHQGKNHYRARKDSHTPSGRYNWVFCSRKRSYTSCYQHHGILGQ